MFMRCLAACVILRDEKLILMNRVERLKLTQSPSLKQWPSYLDEYSDVFSEKGYEHLLDHHLWDHVIDLKPGFKPTDCSTYALMRLEQIEMEKFI